MCGVAGIYAYHPTALPVDRDELLRIRDHMTARGPDGCGLWLSADDRVGLGHRRLAIIDISDDGLQPMSTADGQLRVVYNGEIYNFRELRAQLETLGHVFRSRTDTEVLLAGWQEWGENLVDHLRGMYAFALWDQRRQGLFIARDPFGIKPLYVADDGKTLRIASQVKALLAGRQIDTAPDAAGHVGFFLWGTVPEPHTLYRHIHAFPPGTARWIGQGGITRERRFASVPDLIQRAENASCQWTDAEVQERLNAALRDSVQKHLIADVPTGVFLSSGIDSCTLAALASEVSPSTIHTLTLGFEEFRGRPEDETPLAEGMARQLGTRHETRWVRRQAFESDYAAIIQAMDQPTLDGLNTWFVCKVANEAGFKVALSGLGGDEFFGGYPSFSQIPALVRWLRPFQALSPTLGRGLRALSAPVLARMTSSKYAGLLEYGTSETGAYLLRRGVFMPWELSDCLPPDLLREGLPTIQEEFHAQAPDQSLRPKGRITVLESTLYMRNQLLRDADWAGMAHSIELRVPLVDLEVLAAASRAGKQDLARSPRPALPDWIAGRPKTGFTIPVREWAGQGWQIEQDRGLRGWTRHIHRQLSPGLI